jgi:hypothetical protein
MAVLTAQAAGMAGTAITLTAAAGGGDAYIPTDGDRSWLWIKNGGVGSITVTVTVAGTSFGQNNPDVAVVVANGAERMIGPLVPELAGPDTVGTIGFSYTGVTSVTVAIVRLDTPDVQASLPT